MDVSAEHDHADGHDILPVPAASGRRDAMTGDDDYVELAKRVTEMMKAEMTQRTALTRRVGELEDTLTSVRKELSDLRSRNERLTEQMTITSEHVTQ